MLPESPQTPSPADALPAPASDKALAAEAIEHQAEITAREPQQIVDLMTEGDVGKRLDVIMADGEGVIVVEELRAQDRLRGLDAESAKHHKKGEGLGVYRPLVTKKDGKLAVLPQTSKKAEKAQGDLNALQKRKTATQRRREEVIRLKAKNPETFQLYDLLERAITGFEADAQTASSEPARAVALEQAEDARLRQEKLTGAKRLVELDTQLRTLAAELGQSGEAAGREVGRYEDWRKEEAKMQPGEVRWMEVQEAAQHVEELVSTREFLDEYRTEYVDKSAEIAAAKARAEAKRADTQAHLTAGPDEDGIVSGTRARVMAKIFKPVLVNAERVIAATTHEQELVTNPALLADMDGCPTGLRWALRVLTGQEPPRVDDEANPLVTSEDASNLRIAAALLGPAARDSYTVSQVIREAILASTEIRLSEAGEAPVEPAVESMVVSPYTVDHDSGTLSDEEVAGLSSDMVALLKPHQRAELAFRLRPEQVATLPTGNETIHVIINCVLPAVIKAYTEQNFTQRTAFSAHDILVTILPKVILGFPDEPKRSLKADEMVAVDEAIANIASQQAAAEGQELDHNPKTPQNEALVSLIKKG